MPEATKDHNLLSGRQLEISSGGYTAVATEVGAGLRDLCYDGEALVWGYKAEEMASAGRGQVLVPWPNRIQDGTYTFGNHTGRVPLDEPDRLNAIHGLVRWLTWRVDDHASDRVTLSCALAPQPAYPWRLLVSMTYEVGPGGLEVTCKAQNLSSDTAPYGFGAHPYLSAGPEGADGCSLTLPASVRLVTDARAIPRSAEDVQGTNYDFRQAVPLAGVVLDDCYSGLGVGGDSMPASAAWEATLQTPERRIGLWGSPECGYVMCFTGDTLGEADRRRGVAIEPMTCPPNAYRSGEGLISLAPGAITQAKYGIRLL